MPAEIPDINEDVRALGSGDSTIAVGSRISPLEHPEVQAQIDSLNSGEGPIVSKRKNIIERRLFRKNCLGKLTKLFIMMA
jgi:hypothetical protein